MRALEFKSKIRNNQILIPAKIQPELKTNKDVRVIVLVEEPDMQEDHMFQRLTQTEFLKGYAESDSIYDNY